MHTVITENIPIVSVSDAIYIRNATSLPMRFMKFSFAASYIIISSLKNLTQLFLIGCKLSTVVHNNIYVLSIF